MAKRKFIEQKRVITCLENTAKYYDMPQADKWTKGIHYGLLQGIDNILDNEHTVTEQDIVKPYLKKILNDMFDDEFLQNNMSGDIWERIEDIVNNVLSEDGEEE
jgi:hypothetical protein